MDGVRVRYQTFEIGHLDIHVRTLRDTQQFADADGVAEGLGIPSALWAVFGVVWPSGEALAHLMYNYDVDGLRILEVGCGIGLASLVLNARRADITASDYHPLAGEFLAYNVALNGGPAIAFARVDWSAEHATLGHFDLIIGSDVLYEEAQVHAKPSCEVVIVDPRRQQRGRFTTEMQRRGYAHARCDVAPIAQLKAPYSGQFMVYHRHAGERV